MEWDKEKETLGREIIELLYSGGMIRTWCKDRPEGWVLSSNIWSPFYINLRTVGSVRNSQDILTKIGNAMNKLIENETEEINKIVGIAFAGIPIATAITISSGMPSCFSRSPLEGQCYGEHQRIEGFIEEGDKIAIVDDLVTKFDTKLDVLRAVEMAAEDRCKKINCKDIVVLIDREQGAKEIAKKHGLNLVSLIPFKSKGIHWLKDTVSSIEYETICDYLEDEEKYSNEELQEELRKKLCLESRI